MISLQAIQRPRTGDWSPAAHGVADRLVVLRMIIHKSRFALAAIPYRVLNVRLADYFGIEWRAGSVVPEWAIAPGRPEVP